MVTNRLSNRLLEISIPAQNRTKVWFSVNLTRSEFHIARAVIPFLRVYLLRRLELGEADLIPAFQRQRSHAVAVIYFLASHHFIGHIDCKMPNLWWLPKRRFEFQLQQNRSTLPSRFLKMRVFDLVIAS